MDIFLNGTQQKVRNDITAADLIQELGMGSQRLALEVNEEIVPRSTFDSLRLKPGDHVEIVRAVGGG